MTCSSRACFSVAAVSGGAGSSLGGATSTGAGGWSFCRSSNVSKSGLAAVDCVFAGSVAFDDAYFCPCDRPTSMPRYLLRMDVRVIASSNTTGSPNSMVIEIVFCNRTPFGPPRL